MGKSKKINNLRKKFTKKNIKKNKKKTIRNRKKNKSKKKGGEWNTRKKADNGGIKIGEKYWILDPDERESEYVEVNQIVNQIEITSKKSGIYTENTDNHLRYFPTVKSFLDAQQNYFKSKIKQMGLTELIKDLNVDKQYVLYEATQSYKNINLYTITNIKKDNFFYPISTEFDFYRTLVKSDLELINFNEDSKLTNNNFIYRLIQGKRITDLQIFYYGSKKESVSTFWNKIDKKNYKNKLSDIYIEYDKRTKKLLELYDKILSYKNNLEGLEKYCSNDKVIINIEDKNNILLEKSIRIENSEETNHTLQIGGDVFNFNNHDIENAVKNIIDKKTNISELIKQEEKKEQDKENEKALSEAKNERIEENQEIFITFQVPEGLNVYSGIIQSINREGIKVKYEDGDIKDYKLRILKERIENSSKFIKDNYGSIDDYKKQEEWIKELTKKDQEYINSQVGIDSTKQDVENARLLKRQMGQYKVGNNFIKSIFKMCQTLLKWKLQKFPDESNSDSLLKDYFTIQTKLSYKDVEYGVGGIIRNDNTLRIKEWNNNIGKKYEFNRWVQNQKIRGFGQDLRAEDRDSMRDEEGSAFYRIDFRKKLEYFIIKFAFGDYHNPLLSSPATEEEQDEAKQKWIEIYQNYLKSPLRKVGDRENWIRIFDSKNQDTYLETFLNEAKYLFLDGCKSYQFEIKKYAYIDKQLGPPGTLEWKIANDEYDNQ